MSWKKILTILTLAILIETTITYLFETRGREGSFATFPLRQFSSMLWGFGIQIHTSNALAVILSFFFWFMILLLAFRIIEFASKTLRKKP